MKAKNRTCLFLICLTIFSLNLFAFDWLDYYISFSLLTNLHTKSVYYNFQDMSQFNYHYRLNQPDKGYFEPASVYSRFSADRFNKAQYSLALSISPKDRDFFISLEYSFIDGLASFPLLGGSKPEKHCIHGNILFLERDKWLFSRYNTGISFKGLLKEFESLKVYYLIGIDYMSIDFDIMRYMHLIKDGNIYSYSDFQRKSFSGIGFNFFIESNYAIYKEMKLFIKFGYKYYSGSHIEITSGPAFQHSDVFFNPSSLGFQFGIIHKISR